VALYESLYTQNPDTPHDVSTISYTVKDRVIKFNTDAGVFSKEGLISEVICLFVPFLRLTEVFSILDALRCHWHFPCAFNPSSFVTMIDINERAVDLASQNIHLNGVTNATALTSDGFSNVRINSMRLLAILDSSRKESNLSHFCRQHKPLKSRWVNLSCDSKKQGANSALSF